MSDNRTAATSTEQQSLADFLLARIAEDERVARSATGGAFAMSNTDRLTDASALAAVGWVDHIARHDPARVLAECEAKTRIVEAHPLVGAVDVGVPGDQIGCQNCHVLDKVHEDAIVEALGPCDTLMALALPYADHPDYRDEWRP